MKSPNSRRFTLMALALLITSLAFSTFPVPTFAAPRGDNTAQATAPAAFDCTYIVRPGDSLFRIAIRFGVSPFTLAAVNGIQNINLIFAGMVLRVPCSTTPSPIVLPPPGVCAVYIVQRGDWLALIAARHGVSWQSIAAINHLVNPNLIYQGERLLIPCPPSTTGQVITITHPTPNQSVCSSVMVKGSTNFAPFEAQLLGQVLNRNGTAIGSASIHMDVPAGEAGTFSGQITFDTSKAAGTGSVVVSDISPKDGSVLARASVPILFAVNIPCQP